MVYYKEIQHYQELHRELKEQIQNLETAYLENPTDTMLLDLRELVNKKREVKEILQTLEDDYSNEVYDKMIGN